METVSMKFFLDKLDFKYLAGPIFATITVLAFPPKESCNSLVNFESRYGMWEVFASTSAEITLPRADKDKFILVASFSLSPVAPVLACLSDPAKSTRFNLPTRMWDSFFKI